MWISYKGLQQWSSTSMAHSLFITPLRYLRKMSFAPGAICTDFVSCVNEETKLDPVEEEVFSTSRILLAFLSLYLVSTWNTKSLSQWKRTFASGKERKHTKKRKVMEVLREGLDAMSVQGE